MKSIAQKYENKNLRSRRKLVDKSIQRNGEETFGIRISFTTDDFGDYNTEPSIIRSNMIPIVLNLYEMEIPLSRYRKFDGTTVTKTSSTVPIMFDLLPILMKSRFLPEKEEDRLHNEDLIVYRNFDEFNTPLYLIMQIKEELGVYTNSNLRWREYHCALATPTIQEETAIKELIDSLPNNWDDISNE